MPFLAEAMRAFEEGLGTADDIDTGARIGLNHPMGPLELADFIGLDVCLGVMEVLHEGFGAGALRPAAGARRARRVAGTSARRPAAGSTTTRATSSGAVRTRRRQDGPADRPLDRLDVERLREQRDAAGLGELAELRVQDVAAHEREPAGERRGDLRDRVA